MKTALVRSRIQHWWRQDIRPFVALALILFSLRSSLADWNDVPTGSMRPTIVEGDRVLVDKLAYDLKVPFTTLHLAEWGNPERGDIAVFYSPHDGKRLVKRVIGLPGETLELKEKKVYINGTPLDEPYVHFLFPVDAASGDLGEGTFDVRRSYGPVTVPEGHYFMMGDNRDNSQDSRYWGFMPREYVKGKALFVYFSFGEGGSGLSGLLGNVRWGRILHQIH